MVRGKAYEVGSRLQHKTISLHRVKTSVSIALALRFFFFFWLLFIQLLQLFICSSLAWGGGGCQVKQCNVDLHSRRNPAQWQTKKAQRKQDFVGNRSIQKWCPSSTAFILYRQWLIQSNFKRSLVRAPTKKANDKTVEYPFKVASHHCIHH